MQIINKLIHLFKHDWSTWSNPAYDSPLIYQQRFCSICNKCQFWCVPFKTEISLETIKKYS